MNTTIYLFFKFFLLSKITFWVLQPEHYRSVLKYNRLGINITSPIDNTFLSHSQHTILPPQVHNPETDLYWTDQKWRPPTIQTLKVQVRFDLPFSLRKGKVEIDHHNPKTQTPNPTSPPWFGLQSRWSLCLLGIQSRVGAKIDLMKVEWCSDRYFGPKIDCQITSPTYTWASLSVFAKMLLFSVLCIETSDKAFPTAPCRM